MNILFIGHICVAELRSVQKVLKYTFGEQRTTFSLFSYMSSRVFYYGHMH
jgi:hypothetical protein